MAKVIETIESQPDADFRLQHLARQAGLSLSRFKVRFKEETGMSPRQFIVRSKVDTARSRLRTGQEPIGKIALDLGFPTSQYFATVFRRLMGVSPKQYRWRLTARPSHRREDERASVVSRNSVTFVCWRAVCHDIVHFSERVLASIACPSQKLHPAIVPADRPHVELGGEGENGRKQA